MSEFRIFCIGAVLATIWLIAFAKPSEATTPQVIQGAFLVVAFIGGCASVALFGRRST